MAGVRNRFVLPAGRRHQFAGGREGGRVAQSADPRLRSTVHKVRRGKGEVRGGVGKREGTSAHLLLQKKGGSTFLRSSPMQSCHRGNDEWPNFCWQAHDS